MSFSTFHTGGRVEKTEAKPIKSEVANNAPQKVEPSEELIEKIEDVVVEKLNEEDQQTDDNQNNVNTTTEDSGQSKKQSTKTKKEDSNA